MLNSFVGYFKQAEKAIVTWCNTLSYNIVTWSVESGSKSKKCCILILPFLATDLLREKLPYRLPDIVFN